jgi:hypothetical protein
MLGAPDLFQVLAALSSNRLFSTIPIWTIIVPRSENCASFRFRGGANRLYLVSLLPHRHRQAASKGSPGRRPAWTQRHVWSELGVRISAAGLLPSPSRIQDSGNYGDHSRKAFKSLRFSCESGPSRGPSFRLSSFISVVYLRSCIALSC